MKYFYVYYSYEEFGRGYIGKRECRCLPEEDIKYFGSFFDKSFKPTQKIILEIYGTRKEAYIDEAKLHKFYQVEVYTTKNLKRFCRDYNLNQGNMWKLSMGMIKTCKGYSISKQPLSETLPQT